jgi:hypothetical protein
MSDIKLKEQLKTYSKEKLINILIDFINVCHEQEDIINKAIEELEIWQPKEKILQEEKEYLLAILKGVDKE